MELKWLEDFLSLADSGSFSRSAEQRHVSQPAFSRRIRALEAWLGVALVDRSTFPTRLTEAGEAFKGPAADLINRLHAARALVRGHQTASGAMRWCSPCRTPSPSRSSRPGSGGSRPSSARPPPG